MDARFTSLRPSSTPDSIVAQARVRVLPGDDAAALAARVLGEEHRIYPEALNAVARSLRAARAPDTQPWVGGARQLHQYSGEGRGVLN